MKSKNILGVAFIIGFITLAFMNFGSSVGGYMDFEEAKDTGVKAHVVGKWLSDKPVAYDNKKNIFSFYMEDENGLAHQVHYLNPKPANFEDAEKLVIEGTMKGDVFVADYILVKCPSKYNDTNVMGDNPAAS
ncbi:MAG: cytochrome c maturation protein CcmE [Rhodothermales bacterium]